MPAVLSPNPKKVSVFMKDGQLYEGNIDQVYAGTARLANNVGGDRTTDRVPETGGESEENKEV